MSAPPITLRLAAVAVGLVIGLSSTTDWKPARQFRCMERWLPAASQNFVAAETRSAAPVLSALTSEADAPAVDGWIERMPQGAFASALTRILNHPAPLLRQRWLTVLFARWAKASRADAIKAAFSIESLSSQTAALESVMGEWVKSDPQAAWQFLANLDQGVLRAALTDHVLAAMSHHSPSMAAGWALSLTDPFAKRRGATQVASVWSQEDLVRCRLWGKALEDDDMKRAVLRIVITTAAGAGEPVKAFEMAMEFDSPSGRRDLLSVAVQTAGYRAPQAALTWLRSQRARLDSSMQSGLRAMGELLANDPKQFPQLIATAGELKVQAPLRDAFLGGAVLRLAAMGRLDEARRLKAMIGPGIEREEAKDALSEK